MPTLPKLLMDEFYAMSRIALAEKDFELAQTLSLAEDHVNNISHDVPVETISTLVKNFNGFLDDPQKYGLNPEHILLVKEIIADFTAKFGIEGVDMEGRW